MKSAKLFETAIPLFRELEAEKIFQVFSQSPLYYHYPDILAKALDLIEKIASEDPEQSARLLSMQDGTRDTILHYTDTSPQTVPLLSKLTPDTVFKLFSIKGKNGHTPLYYIIISNAALPLLEK